MNTGARVLDAFGYAWPLVVLSIPFVFFWIFLRPGLLAWVKRDAALQEKRQRMLTDVAVFLLFISLAIGCF